MSQLGDVIRGDKIGRRSMDLFVWSACPDCGKERWVRRIKTELNNFTGLCQICSAKRPKVIPKGKDNWRWKEKIITNDYISVHTDKDEFFHSMAGKNGLVLEHRLVMAKHLGRCLQSWEEVHHKGIRYTGVENKRDNLIDNLELATKASHTIAHSKGYKDGFDKGYYDGKDKRIKELENEVRTLKQGYREAGYKSPEQVNQFVDSNNREMLAEFSKHTSVDLDYWAKANGYKSPEEAKELSIWSVSDNLEINRDVWAKENGYVKLATDQSLPSFRNAVNKSYNDYMLGQEDMLKAGWQKVEVKNETLP